MSVDTAVVGIKLNQTDPNKAEVSHTRNQTKKKEKYPPHKFTYSGRICRCAQFLF